MISHLDHKKEFLKIAHEFEKDFNIRIAPTEKIKNVVHEPSRIVSRLMYLCKDGKEINPIKEYHLYKIIQHSLRLLRIPEAKDQVIRTCKLLAEDCPITLQKMIVITENEKEKDDEPILDLREKTLKDNEISLDAKVLQESIVHLFLTDNMATVFIKSDQSAIYGAQKQAITKENINVAAMIEYVSICHILEKNALLLDLDSDFLCVQQPISEQLAFLELKFLEIDKNILKNSDGIKILNAYGYTALCEDKDFDRFNEFYKTIKKIPNGMMILENYGRILADIPLKFIQTYHLRLYNAIGHPNEMKNILFKYPVLFAATKKNPQCHLIKKYITQPSLLKGLNKFNKLSSLRKSFYLEIVTIQMENNAFSQAEWLSLIAAIKDQKVISAIVIKQYIAKNIKENRSAEEWIITLPPTLQITLFQLLESIEHPLNYFALYAMSDALKDLPVIKASHKAYELEQLRARYVFEDRDQKLLTQDKIIFKTPPPDLPMIDEKTIITTRAMLDDYQKKYLIVDETGEAKPRFLTPSSRAYAYNFVTPHLHQDSISMDHVQKILLSSEFKDSIGEEGFYPFRPMSLFKSLIEWAEKRKNAQIEQLNYWKKRSVICHKVNNNDLLLLELLLDIDVFNSLTTDEFAILFEYGNKALFAEIISRVYPGRHFEPFNWGKQKIDHAFLKQLVPLNESPDELDRTNKIRYEYKIPQLIPAGAKYTGVNPGDAVLTEHQLYQLEDLDIAIGEEILLEEFKTEMVPMVFKTIRENDAKSKKIYKKIITTKESQEIEYIEIKYTIDNPLDEKKKNKIIEKKIELSDKQSSLKTLLLVPMSPARAVLVDSKNLTHRHFHSYKEFKNQLQFIVSSISLTNSQMLAGICNLNANHYVPYFIYYNKKGQIFVLTIDPSYKTSPLLEKCFKDIFPTCFYQDAHIAQQTRQRDCGFNSLQSIHDVAASLHTKKPVLSIIDDTLQFDPAGLTINGNPFKCYDYKNKKTYFLKEFISQGEKNRERWAGLFRKKNKVNNVVDYNYDDNVDKQKVYDKLGGTHSLLAGGMLREIEIYRVRYVANLEFPTREELEKIRRHLIKTDTLFNDLLPSDSAEAIQRSINSILIVFKINYKENTAAGLFNIFNKIFLYRYSLNKDSTAESIYSDFTQTEKYIEFSKLLSASELLDLRQRALKPAKHKVMQESLSLKEQFICQYIHENIEILLKSVDYQPDKFIDFIIASLQRNKKTRDDINMVLLDNRLINRLRNTIFNEVSYIIKKNVKDYWNFLEIKPEIVRKGTIIDGAHVNVIELEKTIHGLLENKHEQAIEPNKKAAYYALMQIELEKNYRADLLRKIENQLEKFVEDVLYHPVSLSYVRKLSSRDQIQLSQKDDYLIFFMSMVLRADLSIPAEVKQDTFHGKILYNHIQNKMRPYSKKIAIERFQRCWDKLMHETHFSEIKDAKDHFSLQTVCQHKKVALAKDETLSDFSFLYQERYQTERNQEVKNFKYLKKQIADFNSVIDFCTTKNLLLPTRISQYQHKLTEIEQKTKTLPMLPLSEFGDQCNSLIQSLSLEFYVIANELYQNAGYIPGSVEPGSYTLHVLHLLSSLFNIDLPHKVLSSVESFRLDNQFKQHLSILKSSLNLHNASRLLLDKLETKNLPTTYGQPLTQRVLLNCLFYWRAHHTATWQTDDGLDPLYFALIAEINRINSVNLDAELPPDTIKQIKQIVDIKPNGHSQYKRWLQHPKSPADLAVCALLNTKTLSQLTYPDKKTNLKEPFTLNHLKTIIQLYYGKQLLGDLPASTKELLSEMKMENLTVKETFMHFTSPAMYSLKNAMNTIEMRHAGMKTDFVLDYTDIQILKQLIKDYVNERATDHDFLAIETNSVVDNIYIILAAFIQENTEEAISIAQLLLPDFAVGQSLERVPLSQLVKEETLLLTKVSSDFYSALFREAKSHCTPLEIKNVTAFIELISKFDQVNSNLTYSSSAKTMSAQFKQSVVNAREMNQLKMLFQKIATKDKPMDEMIDDLFQWSTLLKDPKASKSRLMA